MKVAQQKKDEAKELEKSKAEENLQAESTEEVKEWAATSLVS